MGPGDAGAADGLTEAYRHLRFVHHVESNATAHMRRHGVRSAVLYLSMRPCQGEDGCAENIKATLPVGYRLTVYQVYTNGTVRLWDFKGTGYGLPDD